MTNIYLVGFMGAGKTTVCKKLSKQLRRKSIDLDTYLYEKYHKSSAEIIESESLTIFRKYEKETFFEVSEKQNCVIALGGGTITISEVAKFLQKQENVFYLEATSDILFERIKSDQKNIRPLAKNKTLSEISELLDSRINIYKDVSTKIIDATQSIDKVAQQIQKSIVN